ncbi:hypothetical protein Cob_v007234 [Colletotrichum orbiculare MAFF 240422]|uniref:Uncharacterized protein n=1 Tax=Colletotrichum orbiculare (strain 104-T / ATCC 96160 / CBS 514.97 / LARS 414 / MAFF 240422) TaxID=1213857 RepID=A0A484FR82_COLOR|nr:hypothetical protein Cob_v007234 [Colletotrichum orbiculare MAFF 240422]
MCWLLDETRDVKRRRSRAQNPRSEAWNPWAGRRGGRKRQLDLNSDSPTGTGWGNSDAERQVAPSQRWDRLPLVTCLAVVSGLTPRVGWMGWPHHESAAEDDAGDLSRPNLHC